MKIEKLAENKIKLTVTEEDIESYGMSLRTMLEDAPQMRNFFNALMKKAEKETGFCTDNSRLMIEAHPYERGGMVLLVTNLDRERISLPARRIRAKVKNTEEKEEQNIFEFDSFEDICGYVKNCYSLFRGGKLYLYGGKYYLVASDKLHPLVFEYANKMCEEAFFESKLKEYGKCIIEANAIDVIDQYFN